MVSGIGIRIWSLDVQGYVYGAPKDSGDVLGIVALLFCVFHYFEMWGPEWVWVWALRRSGAVFGLWAYAL